MSKKVKNGKVKMGCARGETTERAGFGKQRQHQDSCTANAEMRLSGYGVRIPHIAYRSTPARKLGAGEKQAAAGIRTPGFLGQKRRWWLRVCGELVKNAS